jgi:phosphodiesterase/alkaline phosphatase D-like protein
MDEVTAEQLAAIVGGEAWQSGGGIYLVTVNRDDGSLVVFSGDSICEYQSDEAFDAGKASQTILLTIPETEELYVIVDLKGNVYYQNDRMERGWKYEQDAMHEATAWESRGEGKFSVVKQSELPA